MNRRARVTAVTVTMGLIVVVLVALFVTREKGESAIRVGAVLPLTGRFAALADPIRHAMDLATEHINEAGGIRGRPVKIVYSDSKGDPTTGASAALKLIDADRITILTTFLTGVSQAVKPISEEKGALLFAQTVSPTITKDAANTIRFHYSFVREGKLLAQYLVDVGQQHTGIVYSSDSSTTFEVRDVILPFLEHHGFTHILTESFDVGERDFKPLAAKLAASDVRQLCILGYGSDIASALREFKLIGLLDRVRLSGNLGFAELPSGTPPELSKGAVFVVPTFLVKEVKTNAVRQFESAYRSRFGNGEIGYAGYYAYDLMFVIKLAIEAAGNESVGAIRSSLGKDEFPVMTAQYRFDNSGDFAPPAMIAVLNAAGEVVARSTTQPSGD